VSREFQELKAALAAIAGTATSLGIFVGVIAPIDPRVETPEEVRDRVLEAARYIPVEQLGTTDDCGFSPFSDDTSTTRDTAFAKIQTRVLGTALAARAIGAGT
jgi:5-methyltetrahydropteroyltriglutamate--homocysteine methyltransferase